MVNLDEMLECVRKCRFLEEESMRQLCDIVIDILAEESNIRQVSSPVIVCGDIHGQFYDMMELFRISGSLPSTKYIFMGDYVDRGFHSVETFTLLMLYKAKYRDEMTLLRGNHESRQITQVYGFYDECLQKYGNTNVWSWCCKVFDYLSIAALVDGRVLCVHGGLSPDVQSLDQISIIDRCQEIPHKGPFCDLVWSDPYESEANEDEIKWGISPRGAGYLFGSEVVSQFNHINGLRLICRAHQLVQEGYKFMFPEKSLVTIWSAPNYCYRCGNIASVLQIDNSVTIDQFSFKKFRDVPESTKTIPNRQSLAPYFI